MPGVADKKPGGRTSKVPPTKPGCGFQGQLSGCQEVGSPRGERAMAILSRRYSQGNSYNITTELVIENDDLGQKNSKKLGDWG